MIVLGGLGSPATSVSVVTGGPYDLSFQAEVASNRILTFLVGPHQGESDRLTGHAGEAADGGEGASLLPHRGLDVLWMPVVQGGDLGFVCHNWLCALSQ